ncbi:hypothetical protein [Amycolatopsis thermoflava]|uniref:hypothetical protein n=1 Tax=Amycolatopsis thermoflava TaxID=84480 RepID=UPI00040C060B|nr:hypothetical protein [Amycolatopsis thermoflava]
MSTDYDREAIKSAAREAAYEIGQECPTCKGDGRVPGGDKVIHSRSRSGFGADWNLDGVLEAIDDATEILWEKSLFGHDLRLLVGGEVYSFEVPAPVRAALSEEDR